MSGRIFILEGCGQVQNIPSGKVGSASMRHSNFLVSLGRKQLLQSVWPPKAPFGAESIGMLLKVGEYAQ